MRRGLPRPTPSAVAMVAQVTSLLVVASGLVAILIGDINRESAMKVERPGVVQHAHR
jgi:hypothetical protein